MTPDRACVLALVAAVVLLLTAATAYYADDDADRCPDVTAGATTPAVIYQP